MAPNYFNKSASKAFLVKIAEAPVEKTNSYQLIVNVLQNRHQQTIGRAMVYLKKSDKAASLNFGDELIVHNNFKPIVSNKNPFEFDYGRYLKINNIHHQGYLTDKQWRVHNNYSFSIYGAILNLRKKLDSWLTKSKLSAQNQKVAKALLLGEKEYLDEATLKSFSSAGAMHVLAVSGLHVGIIMLILQFVLKPIKKRQYGKYLYTLFIIVGVWFYAFITGLSPSVIRAALMFSFIVFGEGLQRQNSIYQSILVSAFIILVFDPFSLFKVGFQLSYLAVLGIVYFQPKIYKTLYFKNRIADYLWQLTSVSIAAQLATFPLGLYYFHQFPNLFFISNILVIPLAGFLLSVGFLYFATYFLTPLRLLLEYIMDFAFSILNYSVSLIEQIPYSILWGISIAWWEVFLIYGIIVSGAIGYISKSKKLIFYFFGLALLFIVFQWQEKKDISSNKSIACYNIKKDFALDIFQGSENIFITTTSLLSNESKLLFHIKHHWFHYRGSKMPTKTLLIDSLENPVFKLENNKTLAIINRTDKPVPVGDYLILYQADFVPQRILNTLAKNQSTIILHPDLGYKSLKYVQRNYPENQLFNIKTEGAFLLSYK